MGRARAESGLPVEGCGLFEGPAQGGALFQGGRAGGQELIRGGAGWSAEAGQRQRPAHLPVEGGRLAAGPRGAAAFETPAPRLDHQEDGQPAQSEQYDQEGHPGRDPSFTLVLAVLVGQGGRQRTAVVTAGEGVQGGGWLKFDPAQAGKYTSTQACEADRVTR